MLKSSQPNNWWYLTPEGRWWFLETCALDYNSLSYKRHFFDHTRDFFHPYSMSNSNIYCLSLDQQFLFILDLLYLLWEPSLSVIIYFARSYIFLLTYQFTKFFFSGLPSSFFPGWRVSNFLRGHRVGPSMSHNFLHSMSHNFLPIMTLHFNMTLHFHLHVAAFPSGVFGTCRIYLCLLIT